jgi:hypothetical protein
MRLWAPVRSIRPGRDVCSLAGRATLTLVQADMRKPGCRSYAVLPARVSLLLAILQHNHDHGQDEQNQYTNWCEHDDNISAHSPLHERWSRRGRDPPVRLDRPRVYSGPVPSRPCGGGAAADDDRGSNYALAAKAEQSRRGSRARYPRVEERGGWEARITPERERDRVYLVTARRVEEGV